MGVLVGGITIAFGGMGVLVGTGVLVGGIEVFVAVTMLVEVGWLVGVFVTDAGS
jgi:hypothetical protein